MSDDFVLQFTFFEDEAQFIPQDPPQFSRLNMPQPPVQGDFLLLAPRSMWTVAMRVWDKPHASQGRLTLWLRHAPEMLVVLKPPPLSLVQP